MKALLETHELILREGLKRTFPIAALKRVRVVGEELIFAVGEEEVALGLGADVAARWARKIATPPPTLAEKLGIGGSAKAWVIGKVNDRALEEALRGATAADAADARLCVAVVRDEADLAKALDAYNGLAPGRAIWIAQQKGARSRFGENAVRGIMRQQGFIDSKSIAVSAELSATRYGRRRPS